MEEDQEFVPPLGPISSSSSSSSKPKPSSLGPIVGSGDGNVKSSNFQVSNYL